jgi:hypothetical protein
MPINKNMPLELLLRKYATERATEFPIRDTNYFERYSVIKDHVASKYYRSAGAGLAMTEGTRFTHHDITHVDDVILAAGHLVGLTADGLSKPSELPYTQLLPYEIYVLLMAALLHDAGNAAGRSNHEQRIRQIVSEFGAVGGVLPVEERLISSIARAHGGKMEDGDKDTITKAVRETATMGNIVVRARRLAALVRLADELSENHTRADAQATKKPYDAPLSVLPNLYCQLINTHIPMEGHSVAIAFLVGKNLLAEEFLWKEGEQTRSILLVDYIAERLTKTELERRYCNRFLANFASCDRITVTLEVEDPDDNYKIIDTINLEMTDTGYPSMSPKIKELKPEFDGMKLRDKHLPHSEAS